MFLRQIVYGLDFDEQRMALATYRDDVSIRFTLNQYNHRLEILETLVFTGTGGKTNTQEALRVADEELFIEPAGDRAGIPNILVLITDGKGNINNDMTVQRALDMKRRGTIIYVVALGEKPDAEVNDVASSPPETYVLKIVTEGDVDEKVRMLLSQVCSRL